MIEPRITLNTTIGCKRKIEVAVNGKNDINVSAEETEKHNTTCSKFY